MSALDDAIAANAEVGAYLAQLVPVPPPVPPPPPPAAPVFDGRASVMSLLQSYETTPGNTGTLVQKQTPAGLWDALQFLSNDITLVPDSRYGQVFDIKVGLGSHAPYYTPTDGRSSELSKIRPVTIGAWDWYGNAYKVVAPFTQPDWCVADQFLYPSLSSPPLGIYIDAGNWSLHQFAGQFTAGNSKPSGPIAQTNLLPMSVGQWLELIVGVKAATDNTGAIQVHTRIPGAGWLTKFDKAGFPTLQWGTVGSTTYPANYRDSQGHPMTVTDHGGLYYGYWKAPPLPSPFPANHIQRRGLTRSTSLADAQATFPA